MSEAKSPTSKQEAEKALRKATKEWRRAKAREREARDALAALVTELVDKQTMNENRIATLTDIPRMTIRKMLGKN